MLSRPASVAYAWVRGTPWRGSREIDPGVRGRLMAAPPRTSIAMPESDSAHGRRPLQSSSSFMPASLGSRLRCSPYRVPHHAQPPEDKQLPDSISPRLAVVLGATLFRSLAAMSHCVSRSDRA